MDRDIEGDEDALDSQYDQDPVGFWEQKQRDLISSAVDYNLSSLSSLIRTNKIDLSPEYQRRHRWDNKRKSQLIESFLMNVPVPPIFLNEDRYGSYSVIDGKQRLTAIYEFLMGRFRLEGLEVFAELNGRGLEDVPSTLQTILETRANIRAIIILRQSDTDIKYQVFQRLNRGGIKLNPQEIRNSAWPGALNTMILEESSSPHFHSALGISDKRTSAIWREMRDAEFVLRFLTFYKDWDTFTGGMGRRLDEFMADNHALDSDAVENLRSDFRDAVEKAMAAFGPYVFKRWQPEKNQWRQQVLASAYDAEIFAVINFSKKDLRANQNVIVSRLQALFSDSEFRHAIDAATNTPSYFKVRIGFVISMLQDVLQT